MKYRLLAIDLDGTLFDSGGRVSEQNRAAVKRARQAGMLVALCTGRGLIETRYAIDALEHEGPVVLAGGALVSDPTTGRTLHRATIEPALAAQLTTHLRRQKQAVLVLLDPEPQEHDYLVVGPEDLNDNTRWWFDAIGADVKYVQDPDPRDMHHALRVGIVAPQRFMASIQTDLLTRFDPQIVAHHFLAVKHDHEDVHVLEVFAQGVNKWSGLSWLAEEHRIGLDETAAIGDHINDVAMIANAACGIAMGNAIDSVKAVARHTTLDNDQHGVAAAIDRLIACEW
jgi:hypothetical protein